MIKAVVFDLDDTLFPEHQFVLSGFQAVGDWVYRKYSVPNFYLTAKQLYEQNYRGNTFNVALAQLNMLHNFALIEELVSVYREHQPKLTLYADANWAISFYAKIKKLGIITDGYLLTQRNKVNSLGLDRIIETIVYSDEHGRDCWKPSKVPYLKFMGKLGYQGEECIYIGDNPTKDFVSAKALGWSTVQICRNEGEYSNIRFLDSHQADYIITSLFELKEIII